MRKSIVYLGLTIPLGLVAGWLLLIDAQADHDARTARLTAIKQLVRELPLTDICLFTEARYTRNPSQADLHSAFQDHPVALEHFPSGSMLLPPTHIWDPRDDMD